MAIYNHPHELVKDTPLLYLPTFSKNPNVKIYAKLELMNPAGGIKDRFGVHIAVKIKDKLLHENKSVLIEATAGNTGLGLALGFIGSGISMIFVIPEKFSIEKQTLLKAMGATIINTPGELGMDGAVAKAEEILAQTPNSFTIKQFENPENPQAHFESTGPEIFKDLGDTIDYFVMGAGSGGTITGISKYLKTKKPSIQTVMVDPIGSLLGGGIESPYQIEGIGNHTKPDTLEIQWIDTIMKVSDVEAIEALQKLIRDTGISAGSSSGANLAIASRLSESITEGTIVTILLDRGERYFSKHILEETLWKK